MQDFILVLNAGSSSLKFALFRGKSELIQILAGAIERIGQDNSELIMKMPAKTSGHHRSVSAKDHASCLDAVLGEIVPLLEGSELTAIGHRIVHGGPRYLDPQFVTPTLLEELGRLSPYDPDHLPGEIALIEAICNRHPKLPQVACFDTAFHQTMPRIAKLLPIPRRFEAQGVQRYGFHGLSYAYLIEELVRLDDPAATKGRVILAHLGNGASMTAVRDGKSVDTSMGFTPASGLVMGTRSGDLDPGLVSYLAHTEQMTPTQFQSMVNHESGLLGISETSSDMRELLEHESEDVRAAEAVALFCYQAKKWIGSFAAALGGLDTLVFAGGIGENSPVVRSRICEGLSFLGIEVHEASNADPAGLISTSASRVCIRVIHTDEELMIARSVIRAVDLH